MNAKKKHFSLNSLLVILIITVTAIVPVLTMADTVGDTEELMISQSMAGSTSGNAISSLDNSTPSSSTEIAYSTDGAIEQEYEYDVALKTEITNVYFTDGTLVSSESQVPGFGVYSSDDERYPVVKSAVPAYKEGYIQVTNTIINQGNAPVRNVGMRIYFDSDAYEHVSEGIGDVPKNTLWVTVPKATMLDSPVWTSENFVVKTNILADDIDISNEATQDFYLKVKDTNLPPEQYYIVSEIVSFQDSNGSDKSSFDVDSLPNNNPNDDLNGQPITFINGNYEKDNVVSEKGMSDIGTNRARLNGDEDDFDFTYALLNDNFYDMALQANITNVFDNDGSYYRDNGLSRVGHASVPSDGAIELSVNIINQGSLPVNNIEVYVYVPKAGYKLLENEPARKDRPSVDLESSLWTIVENPSILPSEEAYMKGDYYVIQGNHPTKLGSGNNSFTLPKLYFEILDSRNKTSGESKGDVSTNPIYYISAEIVEFSGETGTGSTSDAVNPIYDIDSIPDVNPNNDLFYNDSNFSFQTNIIHHFTTFGFVKEREGEITKRGYAIPDLNERTQLAEDEDDFDFTFIEIIK